SQNWTGVFILTLSKSSNDQLPIDDLEHRWPISIIIAIGVDQISIRGCLLYLIEYAATFTFYTIFSNTNQTIRDVTIFRCRPNKDLLISVFLITTFNPTPGSVIVSGNITRASFVSACAAADAVSTDSAATPGKRSPRIRRFRITSKCLA